jgi:hypothetical protein
MIGPVGWRAVIVLTASTLALVAAGCEEQPSIVRGFGSQQLMHVRDASFTFYAQQQDHVYFVTGRDDYGAGTASYNEIDLTTGTIKALGPTKPDLTPPLPPPGRYACEYRILADGTTRALSITDTDTAIETIIEGVAATRPYCPRDDDVRINAWLKDGDGLWSLWRGPYTALEQATLPLVVRAALMFNNGTSMVQGAWPDSPAAFGLYRLDETELTVSDVVAPALAPSAWADGVTPAGTLVSDSLALPLWLMFAGDGRYIYPRAMSDGGQTLFLGPRATDTANELALFRIDEPLPTSIPLIEPYSFRQDGLWLPRPAWLFDDLTRRTHPELRVWHPAHTMITSCPWTGASLYGLEDPARENIAFRSAQSTNTLETMGGPLLVVAPSAGAAAACRQLADSDVTAVDFSPDGSAMYWLVQPVTGVLDAGLWTAAADGTGARMLGSGLIDGPPYRQAPRFIGDSQLELTLGGDLVWVDVHDDPVRLHYTADHVFGSVISLGRWLITGHDYSDQDDNGQLALINRDSGETRVISPAVATFTTPDVPQDGRLRELPEVIRVVYLVRGRNPSPHDGVWMATIPGSDLQ